MLIIFFFHLILQHFAIIDPKNNTKDHTNNMSLLKFFAIVSMNNQSSVFISFIFLLARYKGEYVTCSPLHLVDRFVNKNYVCCSLHMDMEE